MNNATQARVIPCTECQAGVMRVRFITYFTWLGDELITVPNFPAWVCDLCGRREYDVRAVNWLSMLLNPNAGKPSNEAKKQTPLPPKRSGPRPATK